MSVADQQPDDPRPPRAAEPAGSDLLVDVVARGAATVLVASGEVDMRTAPALAEQVTRHFAEPGRRPLVFDLTRVGFFGSAGLEVLAQAHEQAIARDMATWVVAPTRVVSRPLQITGLDALLNVVDNVAAALAEIE